MSIHPKEKEPDLIVVDNKTIQSIQNSLTILEEKFDLRWKHQDFQFKNLMETLDAKFNAVDSKFDAMDVKFKAIDQRFDHVDNKFKDVDKRFDKIDTRLDRLSGRFWQVILVLISYPVALLIGKLCHVF